MQHLVSSSSSSNISNYHFFIIKFCDEAKVLISHRRDLAKYGYKQDLKVFKKIKHPFY
jgi:hypothetical protein